LPEEHGRLAASLQQSPSSSNNAVPGRRRRLLTGVDQLSNHNVWRVPENRFDQPCSSGIVVHPSRTITAQQSSTLQHHYDHSTRRGLPEPGKLAVHNII